MKQKILVFLFLICCLSLHPRIIFAQDQKLPTLIAPDLSISIPGSKDFKNIDCKDGEVCHIPWVAEYISNLQRYLIGIVGIIAVISLMIGGIMWLTSAGNSSQVGEAKKIISGSLIGLFLTFSSYLILYIVNPNLTILKSLSLQSLKKIDLEELLYEVNNNDSLTPDQSRTINSIDKNGIIAHTGDKKSDYVSQSCAQSNFNGGNSVTFYTTGYYKPSPWENSNKFFCSVGLNCSCPVGKHIFDGTCNHKYGKCPYFASNVSYCNRNSSGTDPAPLSCFQLGDKVCLANKITLTVADSGGAIKGRRFDIWSGNDYKAALANTGSVNVTLGPCH